MVWAVWDQNYDGKRLDVSRLRWQASDRVERGAVWIRGRCHRCSLSSPPILSDYEPYRIRYQNGTGEKHQTKRHRLGISCLRSSELHPELMPGNIFRIPSSLIQCEETLARKWSHTRSTWNLERRFWRAAREVGSFPPRDWFSFTKFYHGRRCVS